MVAPNLPTSITAGITDGHSNDHVLVHQLLNVLDTDIIDPSPDSVLMSQNDGRYYPTGLSLVAHSGAYAALDDKPNIIGYQIWNGTAWSIRPTDHTYLYVEAYSDGTAGSIRDANAPEPTGALDGDRWWTVIA